MCSLRCSDCRLPPIHSVLIYVEPEEKEEVYHAIKMEKGGGRHCGQTRSLNAAEMHEVGEVCESCRVDYRGLSRLTRTAV